MNDVQEPNTMEYVRNWKCAQCGEDLIYDSIAHTLTCGCGTVQLPNAMPRGILSKNYHLKRDEKP